MWRGKDKSYSDNASLIDSDSLQVTCCFPDLVLCTCILPVVISGGHMFLPVCRTLRADTDWHFLLHLLYPNYINLFQRDGH